MSNIDQKRALLSIRAEKPELELSEAEALQIYQQRLEEKKASHELVKDLLKASSHREGSKEYERKLNG